MKRERSRCRCTNCGWGGWKLVTVHYFPNGGEYGEWTCPECKTHFGNPAEMEPETLQAPPGTFPRKEHREPLPQALR